MSKLKGTWLGFGALLALAVLAPLSLNAADAEKPVARTYVNAPHAKLGLTDADVARARKEGADDQAIHDTVLIAAAFCMFNRYVDGLATWAPNDPKAYAATGAKLATKGYVNSID